MPSSKSGANTLALRKTLPAPCIPPHTPFSAAANSESLKESTQGKPVPYPHKLSCRHPLTKAKGDMGDPLRSRFRGASPSSRLEAASSAPDRPRERPSGMRWRLPLLLISAVGLVSSVSADAATDLKLGDAAMSKGEYTSAVKHYTNFIAADPGAFVGYTKRAAVYLLQRRLRDAERDLDIALQVEPSSVQALTNRGKLRKQLCRFDGALEDFTQVLELKPGNTGAAKEAKAVKAAKAGLTRARELVAKGELEAAEKVMDAQVLEAAPDCVEVHLLKAELLLGRSDWDGVIAATGRVLKADENDMRGLLLRGRAYIFLGDHDVALRHFQAGLRLDPEHKEHRKAFKQLKNLEKKTKEAEESMSKHKYRAAVEAAQAALELMPEHRKHNVKLHVLQCKAYRKLERSKEAVKACDAALDIEPDNFDARLERGEAKLVLEDWEGAMQDFKHAHNLNQQSREAVIGMQKAERGVKVAKRVDLYKTLDVPKAATQAEIKKAYKKLALKWHPDKNTDNKDEAEAKFREIVAAYEVLGDEEKKAKYDRGEDVDQPEGQGHPGQGFHFQQGGQTFHFQGGGFPGGFAGFQFQGGFPGGFAGFGG